MSHHAAKAAKPSERTRSFFDPFNSSATGHQRAENRLSGSTSWRQSRNLKLGEQFKGGASGGKRISDTVGAGSLDFGQDGRTENGGWEKGAKGLRSGGQQSLWESMKVNKEDSEMDRPAKRVKSEDKEVKSTSVVNPYTPFRKANGSLRESSWTLHECSPSDLLEPLSATATPNSTDVEPSHIVAGELKTEKDTSPPQIFANLTFYVNGCTAPVSDHKLKHLISMHGGSMTIALGRKTVTHVILSKTTSGGGCGGGLAGSKIQKEIASLRGSSIKFVTSQWVTESIVAGKRLPESRYEAMKLAPKGVANISTMFKPKEV